MYVCLCVCIYIYICIYTLYLVVSNDTRKILKRGSEQRNIYVIYCSLFTFKGNHPRTQSLTGWLTQVGLLPPHSNVGGGRFGPRGMVPPPVRAGTDGGRSH